MSNDFDYEPSGEEKAKNVFGIIIIYFIALAVWCVIFWIAGGGFHFGDWSIFVDPDEVFCANDWFVFGTKHLAVNFGDSWWGFQMHRFIFDNPTLQAIEGGILQPGMIVIWLATTVRALAEIF